MGTSGTAGLAEGHGHDYQYDVARTAIMREIGRVVNCRSPLYFPGSDFQPKLRLTHFEPGQSYV